MADSKKQIKPQLNCRHFNGYKPCGRSTDCSASCPQKDIVSIHIVVVHLEALGAVLRATSILPAIKRKFSNCHITWVTQAPAHHLLSNNPYIDKVLTTKQDDIWQLQAKDYDFGFCIDKSLKAIGITQSLKIDQLFGFTSDRSTGSIVPATKAANELWSLGLSNHEKFYVNKKAETQLMIEALELGQFKRDEYIVQLTDEEVATSESRRELWRKTHGTSTSPILGINTGCSDVISYKKLSVRLQRQMIERIKLLYPTLPIVLLGGPEDTARNQEIAEGLEVIQSPTEAGLRDGLCSTEACDIIITGDSLGMHMGIALKKWMVAWFGPTCDHEIDLYDRGVALKSKMSCSPCWKRNCQKSIMCYDAFDIERIIESVTRGLSCITSSSKPHSSETSSSVSRF